MAWKGPALDLGKAKCISFLCLPEGHLGQGTSVTDPQLPHLKMERERESTDCTGMW